MHRSPQSRDVNSQGQEWRIKGSICPSDVYGVIANEIDAGSSPVNPCGSMRRVGVRHTPQDANCGLGGRVAVQVIEHFVPGTQKRELHAQKRKRVKEHGKVLFRKRDEHATHGQRKIYEQVEQQGYSRVIEPEPNPDDMASILSLLLSEYMQTHRKRRSQSQIAGGSITMGLQPERAVFNSLRDMFAGHVSWCNV